MPLHPYEFGKLDEEDLNLAIWISNHYPKGLIDYFNQIAPNYRNRGITLDIPRLLREFSNLLEENNSSHEDKLC